MKVARSYVIIYVKICAERQHFYVALYGCITDEMGAKITSFQKWKGGSNFVKKKIGSSNQQKTLEFEVY